MSRLLKYYDNVRSDEVIELSGSQNQEQEERTNRTSNLAENVESYLVNEKALSLIIRTKEQAKRILEDANHSGQELQRRYIKESSIKVQELESQAHQIGYQKGFALKSDEIRVSLSSLHQEIQDYLLELKQKNDLMNKQHEEQLKFLAIEIASKVLHKRVEADPSEIDVLVADMLSSLKKSQRVHVKLPVGATLLMQKLEEEFRTQPVYEGRAMHVEGADSNQIQFECDMGLYDVSIDTQLENLKKLFLEYGE